MAQPILDETPLPKTKVVLRTKQDNGSRGVKPTAVSRPAEAVRDSQVAAQVEMSITPRTACKQQKAQERPNGSQSLRRLPNSQSPGPREKNPSPRLKKNIIPELEKTIEETSEPEVINGPDHVTTLKQRVEPNLQA